MKYQLTPRQYEILQMLADGKNRYDIERELFLSPKTLDTHIFDICNRFDLHGVDRRHSKLVSIYFLHNKQISVIDPRRNYLSAKDWVISLIAQGQSVASIAIRSNLTRQAICNRRKQVRKLGIASLPFLYRKRKCKSKR